MLGIRLGKLAAPGFRRQQLTGHPPCGSMYQLASASDVSQSHALSSPSDCRRGTGAAAHSKDFRAPALARS